MKKARLFFQFVGIGVFAISLLIAGCTKEGPMGAAGTDGTDGLDGTNGADGTTTCLACHNETTQTTIAAQYASSTHGGSQNFYPGSPLVSDYAGARLDCAKCHSHEGFIETQLTGRDTTAMAIAIPTNITCNTCNPSCNSNISTSNSNSNTNGYRFTSITWQHNLSLFTIVDV